MGSVTNGWNLTDEDWKRLVGRAKGHLDALDDGAFVRAAENPEGGVDLLFHASSINRPPAWHYPFLETLPGIKKRVAYVGRAWHHAPTGFVEFEVQITAAAQALAADFEGGIGDFDDVTFQQTVENAMHGTPADLEWLKAEFHRLAQGAH